MHSHASRHSSPLLKLDLSAGNRYTFDMASTQSISRWVLRGLFVALAITTTVSVPARVWNLNEGSRVFLPLRDSDELFEVYDRTYFFPANRDDAGPVVYLPLQRWDIIFTGDHRNEPGDSIDHENVNWLIPGPFNHIMVYLGKDCRGLAYAVELNTGSFFDLGGLQLICLGADYGILRVPETEDLIDRKQMDRRWAMRLNADALGRLHRSENLLLQHLDADLKASFPYQLEFAHSGSPFDLSVYLVDDGFTGGSGCSDYWTALFEEVAGVCFRDVRISAEEIEAYFRDDPEGRLAYVPAELSPFSQAFHVHQFLSLGFRAVEDAPHVFTCDGTEESGLVIPSRIMESPMMEEIHGFELPWQLPALRLRAASVDATGGDES